MVVKRLQGNLGLQKSWQISCQHVPDTFQDILLPLPSCLREIGKSPLSYDCLNVERAGGRALKAAHGGGGVTLVFFCSDETENAGTSRWLLPS